MPARPTSSNPGNPERNPPKRSLGETNPPGRPRARWHHGRGRTPPPRPAAERTHPAGGGDEPRRNTPPTRHSRPRPWPAPRPSHHGRSTGARWSTRPPDRRPGRPAAPPACPHQLEPSWRPCAPRDRPSLRWAARPCTSNRWGRPPESVNQTNAGRVSAFSHLPEHVPEASEHVPNASRAFSTSVGGSRVGQPPQVADTLCWSASKPRADRQTEKVETDPADRLGLPTPTNR